MKTPIFPDRLPQLLLACSLTVACILACIAPRALHKKQPRNLEYGLGLLLSTMPEGRSAVIDITHLSERDLTETLRPGAPEEELVQSMGLEYVGSPDLPIVRLAQWPPERLETSLFQLSDTTSKLPPDASQMKLVKSAARNKQRVADASGRAAVRTLARRALSGKLQRRLEAMEAARSGNASIEFLGREDRTTGTRLISVHFSNGLNSAWPVRFPAIRPRTTGKVNSLRLYRHGVPLAQALTELSAQAGMTFEFSSEFPEDLRVSIVANGADPLQLIDAIGQLFDLQISQNGKIITASPHMKPLRLQLERLKSQSGQRAARQARMAIQAFPPDLRNKLDTRQTVPIGLLPSPSRDLMTDSIMCQIGAQVRVAELLYQAPLAEEGSLRLLGKSGDRIALEFAGNSILLLTPSDWK